MKFYIREKVSFTLIDKIIDEIKKLDKSEPIDFYISSSGGNLFAVLDFKHWLEDNNISINTYAGGLNNCAATALYLLGDKRYTNKDSYFAFHDLIVNATAKLNMRDIKKLQHRLEIKTHLFDTLISEKTQINLDVHNYRLETENTIYYKAEEALKKGICHKIYNNKKVMDAAIKLRDLMRPIDRLAVN